MPTTASRTSLALAPALVLVLSLTGCSVLSDDEPGPPAAAAAAPPPDVLAGLRAALDTRAEAVRTHDRRAFLAGVTRRDPEVRAEQRDHYATLAQLPLGVFEYELDPAAVVRDGDDYEVVVGLRTQLSGFDERPVLTRDRIRFTPTGRTGQYAVARGTDPQWEAEHDVRPQPWDLGPVQVRSVPGVLGVFDEGSVRSADRLLADVRKGMDDVSGVVPLPWSRAVVLYALSDPAYLARLPDLPGGDPATLDGVAFPVTATPESAELASTRFALHPRLVGAPGTDRSRLIRHELTHVAIGERDDHAPVWLSEGLAEYVSVRPLPPGRRGISQSAVDAARTGFTDLPGDEAFNDADSRVHYGEAWWACEYVATSFGEQTLWSLLDELDDPDLDEAGRNDVLQRWLGLGTRQLARRGGQLLLLTFDPPVAPPVVPPVVAPAAPVVPAG